MKAPTDKGAMEPHREAHPPHKPAARHHAVGFFRVGGGAIGYGKYNIAKKNAPNRCAWLGARKRYLRGAPGGKPARANESTARRGALPMMNDPSATDPKISARGEISIVSTQKKLKNF